MTKRPKKSIRAISMLASRAGSPRTAALSESSPAGSLLGFSRLTAAANAMMLTLGSCTEGRSDTGKVPKGAFGNT